MKALGASSQYFYEHPTEIYSKDIYQSLYEKTKNKM